MKTIHLLTIVGCLALGTAAASATAIVNLIGQPDINVTAASQDLFYQQVSAKTNLVHGLTNDVTVEKSTTTNSTIDASALLALLANSFNTNFPAGTQLLLSGSQGYYSFVISDSTGTNVAPLGVYLALGSAGTTIHSGIKTELTTNQLVATGNDTESYTSAFKFQYDDTETPTGTSDGTYTIFTWNCLIESKASSNLATGLMTENVTITLTGAGEIRGGPQTVFTGTIHAKLTGHKPIF